MDLTALCCWLYKARAEGHVFVCFCFFENDNNKPITCLSKAQKTWGGFKKQLPMILQSLQNCTLSFLFFFHFFMAGLRVIIPPNREQF